MCRVFTTHEQLAVSEEREAELAAAVQEANQSAAAAQRALAAEQETVKCLQAAAMPSEQVGPSVSPLCIAYLIVGCSVSWMHLQCNSHLTLLLP